MLIPRPVLLDVATRLRDSAAGLRIVSAEVDVDPLDLVRGGARAFAHASFYSTPGGTAIGALGTAATYAASGPNRLRTIDAALGDLDPGIPLVFGMAFDADGPKGVEWEGFPAGAAVIPAVTVRRREGRSTLSVALPPGADGRSLMGLLATLRSPGDAAATREVDHVVESRPPANDWRDLVGEGVAAIRAGAMQKVVLARSVSVRAARPIEAFDIVSLLRDRYPECRIYGWQAGGSTLVGASPEVLVTREGSRFSLSPLAGSAPRGDDPDSDRSHGDGLLASPKDQSEHRIVVEDVLERLEGVTTAVDVSPAPTLQRFATVQHLATTIAGVTDARVLELAELLHPTPAVGGSPRGDALAFIEKMEGLDRGWYSGATGWVDPGGDGELAIALRCALVRGSSALLYAGNGIVAGSHPDAELEETRLKLRPLLELLTAR